MTNASKSDFVLWLCIYVRKCACGLFQAHVWNLVPTVMVFRDEDLERQLGDEMDLVNEGLVLE